MLKTHYRAGLASRRAKRRGQGLVEMALIAPLMLVLAMGTLEVGLLLASHYNVLYATREAARIGAFARCSVDPVTGSTPDDSILRRLGAALKDKIAPQDISRVIIYKADAEGDDPLNGAVNIYTNFAIIRFPGPTDPAILTPTGIMHSGLWDPEDRGDNPNPYAGESSAPWLGVRIFYTHTAITFLGPLMAPNGKFPGSQRTVMRIEPAPDPLRLCIPE